MAAPFGRKNPRPVYKTLLEPPTLRKSKPKAKQHFTSNNSLYACTAGAIVFLILGVMAFQS
jgi:hypothetical protein